MKTRTWILLFAALALICGVLTVVCFLPQGSAGQAQILQDGDLLYTVDLHRAQVYEIDSPYGRNTVEVWDGKIAVTAADCPDGYCQKRGWCDSGADIVCLPHHLVIRFTDGPELDGMTGQ